MNYTACPTSLGGHVSFRQIRIHPIYSSFLMLHKEIVRCNPVSALGAVHICIFPFFIFLQAKISTTWIPAYHLRRINTPTLTYAPYVNHSFSFLAKCPSHTCQYAQLAQQSPTPSIFLISLKTKKGQDRSHLVIWSYVPDPQVHIPHTLIMNQKVNRQRWTPMDWQFKDSMRQVIKGELFYCSWIPDSSTPRTIAMKKIKLKSSPKGKGFSLNPRVGKQKRLFSEPL
jgi:hypothetical protein